MKAFQFLLVAILSLGTANAHESGKHFTKNYFASDYGAHVQNWTISQDNNGVMFFGNTDGLLTYDGVNWSMIDLPTRDLVRSLTNDSRGRIYVGGLNLIGYIDSSPQDGLHFVCLTHKVPDQFKSFYDVWETHAIGNDIYFRAKNHIFKYVDDTLLSIYSDSDLGLSFIFNRTLYVSKPSEGLFYLKENELVPAPRSELFANQDFLLAYALNNDTVIIGTSQMGLLFYSPFIQNGNVVFESFETPASTIFRDFNLASTLEEFNGLFYLSTPGNGCIVFGKDGKIIKRINQLNGISTDRVHNHYFDKHSNLWLATNKGISKVNVASPISFWDVNDGLDGNVETITRFNNTLYIGTHQGLYNIDGNRISKSDAIHSTVWSFLELNDSSSKKDRLLVGTSNGIYEVVDNRVNLLQSTPTYVYNIYQSKFNPNLLYACMTDGVRVYSYINGTIKLYGKIEGVVDNVRSIYEPDNETMWLGTFRNGAIKLSYSKSVLNPTVSYYGADKGLSSNKNVLFFDYNNSFVIGSDGGLNTYNPKTDRIEPDSSFGMGYYNGERDVFSFIQTTSGKVWISGLNNKRSEIGFNEILPDKSTRWVATPFKLIPEMMVLAFYVEEDGTAWIGGSDGLFRYDPEKQVDYDSDFRTIIRSVTISNDSVIYKGMSLSPEATYTYDSRNVYEIDYNFNSIVFDFAAVSFINEQENSYSYFLEGYEDRWSSWQKHPSKEYTNLPPGDYVFQVKGKNVFETESQIVSFPFRILSPWYRTIWAYILYFLAFIGMVYGIVYFNAKRLRAENRKLEAIVYERTSELSEVNTQLEEQQAELEIRQEEITAQARLLELKNYELEKLSLVARETENAVIIMDSTTKFEWVNEGFSRMYESDFETLKNERGGSLIVASQKDDIVDLVNKCIEQKVSVTYESENLLKSNKSKWIQTTLTPILGSEGEVRKLIAVESDITKLKVAEHEIYKQRDELVILNRTKDKFFRIIAHDLRNPFNNIMGLSEIIIEKIKENDKKTSLSFTEMLHKTSVSAYELLENLLTWSRSQSGAIPFSPSDININKLLEYNVILHESSAKVKGITIKSSLNQDIDVFADKNMILTILRNLVTNAIKFTKKGGVITLDAKDRGDFIEVSVTDTGIGISESVIGKLFKIDENVGSEGTNNEPGTGLGLILCKEFVKANGGEIWVDSKEGEGSRFLFTLKKSSEG